MADDACFNTFLYFTHIFHLFLICVRFLPCAHQWQTMLVLKRFYTLPTYCIYFSSVWGFHLVHISGRRLKCFYTLPTFAFISHQFEVFTLCTSVADDARFKTFLNFTHILHLFLISLRFLPYAHQWQTVLVLKRFYTLPTYFIYFSSVWGFYLVHISGRRCLF